MHSKPLAINEHGQITIPKFFREILKSPTVMLEQDNDNPSVVRIIPIPDVGGSLSDYAKKEFVDFKNTRETAWDEEINDKLKHKNKCK